MENYQVASVVDEARAQLDRGVFYEPRIFHTTIETEEAVAGAPSYGRRTVDFRNGEQNPVTFTHVVTLVDPLSPLVDQSMDEDPSQYAVSTAARLRYHDQWYPSSQFMPLGLWANQPTGSSRTTINTFHWDLTKHGRICMLGMRDTLQVSAAGYWTPTGAYNGVFTVVLFGVGVLSARPYTLTGRFVAPTIAGATTFGPTILDTRLFRNDGTEPIAVTSIGATFTDSVSNAITTAFTTPAIRFNIRTVGAGSNANWFVGGLYPQDDSNYTTAPQLINTQLMPVEMCGVTVGRAAVHKLPEPVTLQPGDGIDEVAATWFATDSNNDFAPLVDVGLVGYVELRR
jgi:hypothetical protein